MANQKDLSVGAIDDDVVLVVNDKAIVIAESYEIKISVMTQPAAFSLRLGWGDTAKKLIATCPKGSLFQLRIAGNLVQSGIVDGLSVPKGNATVLEVKGRDYMRKLMNSHVKEDIEFREKTYYDLTRRVMDLVGLQNHKLIAGNGANRRAVTATKVAAVKAEEQVRVIETGIPGPGGAKMEFKSLKAKVGQRWYDWLQDKYRLAGIFLWCSGNGHFVLSTPGYIKEPSYVLARQRGSERNLVNILSHSWRDDATGRHAHYIVYGRSGHGKGARTRLKGEYHDKEMGDLGFTDIITYHEDDIATTAQAEYLARRYAAEERRAGWELSYTMAGHRTPGIQGGVAVWGPDTMAQVADEELGIEGSHYIESVTYTMSPQKETTVELIRPSDLLYIAEANQDAQKKAKGALQRMQAAPEKPVTAAAVDMGEHGGRQFGEGGSSTEWDVSQGNAEWDNLSWKWDAEPPAASMTEREILSFNND